VNLGYYHPIVVHFAIALTVAGIVLRWISLLKRPAFAGPAATTLVLAGTVAILAAYKSGLDAHGPVERIPGLADVVHEHEEAAEVARNFILAVAALEIASLVARLSKYHQHTLIASSVLGVGALVFLVIAGNRGGNLVYSHAGGVGIRTPDTADVGRLLLAGLFHQAHAERTAGRTDDAAALADMALRRFPNDIAVRLFQAESILLDRKDPAAALAALGTIAVPKEDARSRLRHGWLTADALEASGQKDAARATLQSLLSEFPDNERLKRRLGAGR
jgi:uncharacterized membrane protein